MHLGCSLLLLQLLTQLLLCCVLQGFIWAQVQASKRQNALLDKRYTFYSSMIEYLQAYLQHDMLPQLKALAATYCQRMGLRDAQQQAALFAQLAAKVLDVRTPEMRSGMHVVSQQRGMKWVVQSVMLQW
jgi:hypothetical protein